MDMQGGNHTERDAAARARILARYLRRNVLGHCGQAVTRLAEAGLVQWPVQPESEFEVHEWWLVSDELAVRLRDAGAPVLRFGELNRWGRSAAGIPLRDDAQLAGVIPA